MVLILNVIVNASIDYFTAMYTLVCICVLLLTLIGAEVSKNSKSCNHLGLDILKKVNVSQKDLNHFFT